MKLVVNTWFWGKMTKKYNTPANVVMSNTANRLQIGYNANATQKGSLWFTCTNESTSSLQLVQRKVFQFASTNRST